ncbi:MAG TPA: hypothetical protein VMP01_04480, partial [Pirellulaceae bacterium]|nr:hypothetical protein [Pirellulaceae bacterium]
VRRLDRIFLRIHRLNRHSRLVQLIISLGCVGLFYATFTGINLVAGKTGVTIVGVLTVVAGLGVFCLGLFRYQGRDQRRKLRQRNNAAPKDFAIIETQTPKASLVIWFHRLLSIWGALFALLACVEIGIWLGEIPPPPNQMMLDRLWATIILCGFLGALYSLYWPLLGGFFLVRLAGAWLWRSLNPSSHPPNKD